MASGPTARETATSATTGAPDRPPSTAGADRHEAVAAYFAEHADSWRSRYGEAGFDADRYRTRARIALDWLGAMHNGRLLEIGCGAGVQAGEAAASGWDVTAIDLSHAVVAEAARRTAGPRWTAAAAEALPFRDAAFDAVLMLGLLGYVVDPVETLLAARRALRPGGRLIVSWRSPAEPLLDRASQLAGAVPTAIYRRLKQWLTRRPLPGDDAWAGGFYDQYDARWTPREFHDLLSTAGFRTDAWAAHDFGRLRFMGKRLWPEAVDIAIGHACRRLADARPLHRLRTTARLHLVLASPAE